MKWSRVLPAVGRRAVVALGVAALLGAPAMAYGQQPAATPAPPDPLKFNLDVPLLLIYSVKPDKTADFESVWAAIKEGLAKSDKPELKTFGEGLNLFKADTPAPPAGSPPVPAIYLFRIDAPSKTISYNPVKLLYESGIFKYEEATPLYEKFKDTYTGIQFWPMVKIGG
jgi:hypothetical protein